VDAVQELEAVMRCRRAVGVGVQHIVEIDVRRRQR
jgi:hypothetical protein